MTVSIMKNVPIPSPLRPYVQRERKYPFDTIGVGEMFFVPNRERNTMSTHASMVGKELRKKFVTRLLYAKPAGKGGTAWAICDEEDEGAVLGIAVWRTK